MLYDLQKRIVMLRGVFVPRSTISEVVSLCRIGPLGGSASRSLQHHQQQQQQQLRISTTAQRDNPFRILGIPPNSSLKTAQKAFLRLALQHHPDTNTDNDKSDGDKAEAQENFVRIRQAFELIRDGSRPYKTNQEQNDDEHNVASWTEEDFLHWFYEQTGMRLSSDQRRELVNLYRGRIPGGRYDGPHWELARRLVAEQDAFLRHQYQQQQRRGHSFSSSSSSSSNSSRKSERKSSDKNTNPIRRKRLR